MRILFQGAGAIGIAGAALFGDRHEVVVVTREGRDGSGPAAAYPHRVGWFDAQPRRSAEAAGAGGAMAGCESTWWASDIAETRRVTITDWAGIADAGGFRLTSAGSVGSGSRAGGGTGTGRGAQAAVGAGISIAEATRHWQRGRRRRARDRRVQDSWDLVVLTTRPGDLDEDVASAIRAVAPRWLAITSLVDGDVNVARSLFPGAEVVIFAPTFLSERIGSLATDPEVRYWTPLRAPVFFAAGPTHPVRRLGRVLGSLVMPVPTKALLVPPAVFIPYVAELSARGGDWAQLLGHLRRPSEAATEAIGGASGMGVPMLPAVARVVLEALEGISPIPMRDYAGRHFARHEGQTLAMLEGWIGSAREHEALSALADELRGRTDRR